MDKVYDTVCTVCADAQKMEQCYVAYMRFKTITAVAVAVVCTALIVVYMCCRGNRKDGK